MDLTLLLRVNVTRNWLLEKQETKKNTKKMYKTIL